MLRLTDEENITQVPDICYLVKDSKGFRVLSKSNKAQLKKVVVVLDLVGNEENVNNEDIFVIPAKLWQALLKEVEDE